MQKLIAIRLLFLFFEDVTKTSAKYFVLCVCQQKGITWVAIIAIVTNIYLCLLKMRFGFVL